MTGTIAKPMPHTDPVGGDPDIGMYDVGPSPRLISRRVAELQLFRKSLDAPGFQNELKGKDSDALFSSMVDLAINDYGVSQTSLARMLDCSVATVGRWSTGRSKPHRMARSEVVAAICELIDLRISTLENRQRNTA